MVSYPNNQFTMPMITTVRSNVYQGKSSARLEAKKQFIDQQRARIDDKKLSPAERLSVARNANYSLENFDKEFDKLWDEKFYSTNGFDVFYDGNARIQNISEFQIVKTIYSVCDPR